MSEAGMRYLLEALSAGSMRAAGDRLNVAPSSISRQIAQLESQYGLALIEKGRRGVRLTHAGEIVIAHYRNQLADREALRAKLEELRSVRTGQVTAAIGDGFAGQSFTSIVSQFSQANPLIRLEILTGSTTEILRMIADDEAHFGLVFSTPNDMKIHVRSVIAQPLMAIMLPDNPLAAQPSVTIAQLAQVPLVLPPAHFRIRQILSAAEANSKTYFQPAITSNSIHVMQDMVRAGIAVAILPQISVWSELTEGAMVSVPIADDSIEETTTSLVLRSGRQLEGAPLRLLKRIEAQLRQWNRPVGRER
ncbi:MULTISPECIES: LysR family transcriptional regulator [Sphingomonadaceae]|uniref:Transcriptional regulator n=2 Tax=Novosphingobium resinovorum TaxID=158500 RepID=A0A031JLC3_9SPHN|nr:MULTISPECIES: LysR family transcriptional regulator [Sphingomonadaceae]EZP75615.1 Transcriptional regulator [Novosphingobium resinovorum]GLK46490.1 LysR family transcriptional regulator [Novosphingobium resinovorum]